MGNKFYSICLDGDNSLKQFFDRFYVIPKDYSVLSSDDKKIIENYAAFIRNELIALGKDGYIVFRGKRPKKLTEKQICEIKSDTVSTQRELAFKYNVCHATIGKIKNNKY